jgi:cbb3-type cytochrome oxidase maturation protein
VSILYVLVPVALGVVVVAVAAYVWSARSGQFDDLETPSLRPLIDDDPRPARREDLRD